MHLPIKTYCEGRTRTFKAIHPREQQRAALPFAYFASRRDGTRTHTPYGLGILSPLRLPIPPLTVKTKKQLFRVAWDLKTVFIFYFQLFFPSSPFKCFAKRAEPNDTPLPHKPESFINEKDFAVIFTLFVKFI